MIDKNTLNSLFGDTVAPNGKLTRDNFADWFSGSVVVDEGNLPLVVFHGTVVEGTTYNARENELPRDAFRSFDNDRCGSVTGATDAKSGFWFTSSLDRATDASCDAYDALWDESGSRYVYRVFLRLENPVVLERVSDYDPAEIALIAERAKIDGKDGIIFTEGEYGPPDFLVFSGNQVKSATQNNGIFDASNSDITDLSTIDILQVKNAERALKEIEKNSILKNISI